MTRVRVMLQGVPAFIMGVLFAALFYPAPVRQRGLRFGSPSALRGTSGGATMTTLGGAGTSPMHKRSFLRARRIGFYHGVGAPTGPPLGAPARRFAPPRCPKPSPLCGCVRVHQHIIPDDMSVHRRRSWSYRGGAMLNFAITEFSEVRKESCNKYCN